MLMNAKLHNYSLQQIKKCVLAQCLAAWKMEAVKQVQISSAVQNNSQ